MKKEDDKITCYEVLEAQMELRENIKDSIHKLNESIEHNDLLSLDHIEDAIECLTTLRGLYKTKVDLIKP